MNQFPLCAAEKSLSFVIGSQTISCPIKVRVIQYLERHGTAWRGEKKKVSVIIQQVGVYICTAIT